MKLIFRKTLVFALAFLTLLICVHAEDVYSYDENKDGASFTFFNSEKSEVDVVIPSKTPDGRAVTAIDGTPFWGDDNVKSITFPNTLKRIEESALAHISDTVESLTFPEGLVSIGDYAFSSGGFKSVHLPSTVTSIGYRAFEACRNLETITVAEGNPVYYSEGNCIIERATGKLIVGCKGSRVPAGVREIGDGAFTASGVVTLELPEGVTRICDSAFRGCEKLETIKLPTTLTDIDKYAFANCRALHTVWATDIKVIGDNAFENCYALKDLYFKTGPLSIGKDAFANCRTLEVMHIPNVTEIGARAFYNCSGITSVLLSKELTKIPDYVFYYCSSLKFINLPDSLTYIGKYAFSRCTSLEYVVIPDSVKYLDDCAFRDCTSLKDITLSKSLTYIPMGICYGCTSLERFVIPDGVTSIEGNIVSGSSIASITIPASVVNVTSATFSVKRYTKFYYAGTATQWFDKIEPRLDGIDVPRIQESLYTNRPYEKIIEYNKDNLSMKILIVNGEGIIYIVQHASGDIVIPREVEGYPITKIDYTAFASQKSLKSVVVPDSIVELGGKAFYNCVSLEKVSLPDSIDCIYKATFTGCKSLKEIELPKSITAIRQNAFSSCTALERIEIPEGVTVIGDSAFYNCSALKEVIIPDGVSYIGKSAFYDTSSLSSIKLPKNLEYIGGYAFQGSGLESIELPEGLKGIGYYAFCNTKLKEIYICGSAGYVGESAFYGCNELESVVAAEGLVEIYEDAFANCPKLKSLTFPSTLSETHYTAFKNCPAISDICFTNTDKAPVNLHIDHDVTPRFKNTSATYTFNANGGSAVDIFTGVRVMQAPYSEKEGFVLAGWYLSPDFSYGEVTFPYCSSGDVTLYAKWIPREDCIIMTIDQKEAFRFGESVTNDVAPIIENGRTMLPVRFVADSLGAKVEWFGEASYIKLTGEDGRVIDMRVGEKGTLANGGYNELEVAPFIRDGRTYTPVRFVAEALGAKVIWNAKTREAILVK